MAHDKAFIEECAFHLSLDILLHLLSGEKLQKTSFTQIMMLRCKQAVKGIHSMRVEFDTCLTYLCCIEDNLDHKNITFELKTYKHNI
jgi:hypothetical protein